MQQHEKKQGRGHDAKCVMGGAWCMVHGAWCMVHGAWCMVHGLERSGTRQGLKYKIYLSDTDNTDIF
jgi:hypothetical protein